MFILLSISFFQVIYKIHIYFLHGDMTYKKERTFAIWTVYCKNRIEKSLDD